MPNSHPIKALPSVEYLRACFDYDPATGILRWKRRPRKHFASAKAWKAWNTKYDGNIAGRINDEGYFTIYIMHRPYKGHRIIWKLMTGKEPPETMDHKNRDRSDNRWRNLKQSTHVAQALNRKVPLNNTSGFIGVWRNGGRWRARIRRTNLGYFDTPEEAGLAYKKARATLDAYSSDEEDLSETYPASHPQ